MIACCTSSRLVFVLLTVFAILDRSCPFLLEHSTSTPATTALCSFDFASKAEWDRFYQKTTNIDGETIVPAAAAAAAATTEWHSSVPLDDIAMTVPPNGRCLVIGCGNSVLPERILQRNDGPRSLVLLDSSSACLDQLRHRYRDVTGVAGNDSNTEIEYVCGDAIQLSRYFNAVGHVDDSEERPNGNLVGDQSQDSQNKQGEESSSFDIIIDKGLTDAILCGEGWDGPLEQLLYESAKVLSMGTGKYLLISYKLPSSTKDFLVTVGKTFGLEWEFDFDLPSVAVPHETCDRKAYQRVSIAMARRNDEVIQ
mmetsp:Transcript_21239/g.50209  ORF Transcript_21239/g.50209 Transcript_21239/m.50209 type:complete len:310 (+) Transcript_21239:17-946(+)